MANSVLLIEDDEVLRRSLSQTFELADFKVLSAPNFIIAADHIRADFDGVILTDIRMPGKDGFHLLEHVKKIDEELPVVMLTGQGDVPMAVRAISQGAYDFRQKPCPPDELIKVIEQAMRHRKLVLRARKMQQRLEAADAAAVNFPGSSQATEALRQNLRKISEVPVHAYIYGAPGAGKRIAAHTIFTLSAASERYKTFSMRDMSVDEIAQQDIHGAMHVLVQDLDFMDADKAQALLTLMESEPEVCILGSARVSLEQLKLDGLHNDLYYAFEFVQVEVPSLFQRKQDIPEIFEALVRQTVRTMNATMPDIPEALMRQISLRDWNGNLPELRNFTRRFVLGADVVEGSSTMSLNDQLAAFEKLIITESLRQNTGQIAATATALQVPSKTLYDKMKRFGLRAKDFRQQ